MREQSQRLAIPETTIIRMQKWIEDHAKDSKTYAKSIRRKRGNVAWNEMTFAEAVDMILKKEGY